jgi:hypothetical protein
MQTGEPILEPEVDLSAFLEKQKISDDKPVLGLEKKTIDEDEVDASLAHISSNPNKPSIDRKGKVQEIKWDRELEEMSRAKAAAEAQRGKSKFKSAYLLNDSFALHHCVDLKARFKAKSEKLKAKPVFKSARERQAGKRYSRLAKGGLNVFGSQRKSRLLLNSLQQRVRPPNLRIPKRPWKTI